MCAAPGSAAGQRRRLCRANTITVRNARAKERESRTSATRTGLRTSRSATPRASFPLPFALSGSSRLRPAHADGGAFSFGGFLSTEGEADAHTASSRADPSVLSTFSSVRRSTRGPKSRCTAIPCTALPVSAPALVDFAEGAPAPRASTPATARPTRPPPAAPAPSYSGLGTAMRKTRSGWGCGAVCTHAGALLITTGAAAGRAWT